MNRRGAPDLGAPLSCARRVQLLAPGASDVGHVVPSLFLTYLGPGLGCTETPASDPPDLPRIIALSRASYRKMVQDLKWTGCNYITIPPAAGVLAPCGIALMTSVGAVLMSLRTIIVVINARLLRRVRL